MDNILFEEKMTDSTPLLRWAGGKYWLLKHLDKLITKKYEKYYEPFFGGGAVFFYLSNNNIMSKSFLSDLNPELINFYKCLKKDPEKIYRYILEWPNEKKFYYEIRNRKFIKPYKQAARFYYLNRTSFNGIYRVNLKGEYNVPYGNKDYKTMFDASRMASISNLLQESKLKINDFEKSLEKAGNGDLVFLDPPYTVAHENNGFVKYNQKIFSWEDQIRLYNCVVELNDRGGKFILTNAAHSSIKDLYGNKFKPLYFERSSVVGGKSAQRGTVREFIFTNLNVQ